MNLRRPLVIFLLAALLGHGLVVLWAPTLVNLRVTRGILERVLSGPSELPEAVRLTPVMQARAAKITERGGYNVALPAVRATAASKAIVRPSPDLLYTVCLFDLERGPLRVRAPVQDSYLSVSGYADNTDNFFALNDREIAPGADGSRQLDLLIARPGQAVALESVQVIEAPSDRGVILFRSLVTSEAQAARIRDEYQLFQECDPLR